MTYHLILCTRKHEQGNVNLEAVLKEALGNRQESDKELDGITLLCHNAILVHPNQMYGLGALILARLQERAFPYVVFQIPDQTWQAYDNIGKPIKNILEKSS